MRRLVFVFAILVAGCPGDPEPPQPAGPDDLQISEVVSANLGGGPHAGRDDRGDWDDWIELSNLTDHAVDIAGLWVSDRADDPKRYQLPADEPIAVEAHGRILLYADGETHQGARHLPFLLSRKGEVLSVATSTGATIDRVEVPALHAGESYALVDGAFTVCATPSPSMPNDCIVRPTVPKTYEPFEWPALWPAPKTGLFVSEIHPLEGWIELTNLGATVDLTNVSLSFETPQLPRSLPETVRENVVDLTGRLLSNERAVVTFEPASAATFVLLDAAGSLVDRVVYEAAIENAVLARPADHRDVMRWCQESTRGESNGPCTPAVRTDTPSVLRALRAPSDVLRLAEYDPERTSDARSVKFVIDRLNGHSVYYFDSNRWSLHFDWIWEVVDRKRPFDKCDAAERAQHSLEWSRFSQLNYFNTTTRQYYLGTIVYYADSDLYTIEFASGDMVTPQQMIEVFFLVARNFYAPERLFLRPTTASFESRVAEIEGQVPIVPADAPFEGVRFVALNPGVAYGVLEHVKADEIESADLSFQSIPIFDRIPNDVPLVGGTITEELQTPLAHVNVLAQNRGTPNMSLVAAASDPRVQPFLGQLVRLEVARDGFDLRVATSSEAEAFWEERFGSRPPFVPMLDPNARDVVALANAAIHDTPRIGAKAAQYAELMNLDFRRYAGGAFGACAEHGVQDNLPVPRPAFAVPFARYVEHLETNGIDTLITAMLEDEDVLANPARRKAALEEIRDRIEDAPVDAGLLAELESLVAENFGQDRVRLRSSTNVEDLVGFNGAGLYDSKSAAANSRARPIDDALRRVWASTFSFRAFEERRLFNVDESKVAMGVLLHRGFPAEEANGVAITRNVIDPGRGGYYVNAQFGEISIVNPEGAFVPEQLLYKPFNPPEVNVVARSNVDGDRPVLSSSEVFRLACTIGAAHNRFRDYYTDTIAPETFALDVEFKIDGADRQVFLKQARPWIGPPPPPVTGCE